MAWKKQLQRQRSVSLSLSSKWKSLKATEAMQRAQQAVTTSTVGASSSVSTAAESFKNACKRVRPNVRLARMLPHSWRKSQTVATLTKKLAEAGIGGSNKK
ncbi:PspA/IM30 family protein [Escherichia coli]